MAAKQFHKNADEILVRRGHEEVKTTVKKEVGKQIEIYLSNAKTRKRRSKAQKDKEQN